MSFESLVRLTGLVLQESVAVKVRSAHLTLQD